MHDNEYVFCTVDPASDMHMRIEPLGWFRKPEGISLIIDRRSADTAQLNYGPIFRIVSLRVHSNLQAVGFLAAIASKLASAEVSLNAISAYHHDHLLVPKEQAARALQVLTEMMNVHLEQLPQQRRMMKARS